MVEEQSQRPGQSADATFRIERDTMGEVRVPAACPVAGADPAGGGELPDLGRADSGARHIRALALRSRAPRRRSTPSSASSTPTVAKAIQRRRRRGRGGRARRPVPDRRLPDRLRHLEQHEHQRGDRARWRRRRSAARCIPTTTSTPRSPATTCSRPRSTSRRPTRRSTPGPGARPSRGGARGQGGGVRRGREVRPHPPDGRHAGHPRPGVRRLRRPGPLRHRPAAVHRSRGSPNCRSGGTAVGTGINTPPGFAAAVIARARGGDRPAAHRGAQPLRGAGRPGRARRGCPASSARSRVGLYKIANDIRWMGSGPRAGLGEIALPDLQPGSSIMPGKVNPVICEAVRQVARR